MGNKQKSITDVSEKYFLKELKQDNIVEDNLKQKIQINWSISNIQNPSDKYHLEVSLSYSKEIQSKPISTKTSHHSLENQVLKDSLYFPDSTILDYYFERQQFLEVKVFKNSSQISCVNTTVGKIMGSRGQKAVFDTNDLKLIIQGNALKDDPKKLIFSLDLQAEATSVLTSYKDHLRVVYQINRRRDNCPIYRSQVFSVSKASQVIKPLRSFELPFALLQCEMSDHLYFQFRDIDKDREICSCSFDLSSIIYTKDLKMQVNSDVNYSKKVTGAVFNLSLFGRLISKPSFIDYLRGGMQISLVVGIDYTASNGTNTSKHSLHYFDQTTRSPYEIAIENCGNILAYYDYDQLFPVYGFGARLNHPDFKPETYHCFPINFSNDPKIYTVPNIIQAYRGSFACAALSGGTCFAPLIAECLRNISAEHNPSIYYILMILTDGAIGDMDQTVNQLVFGSGFPLSIIIVGIGNADFSAMEVLDADDSPLVDDKGNKACRDFVQFVPFNKFAGNGERLAQCVLEEVPRQVVEYYQMKKIPPGDPIVS